MLDPYCMLHWQRPRPRTRTWFWLMNDLLTSYSDLTSSFPRPVTAVTPAILITLQSQVFIHISLQQFRIPQKIKKKKQKKKKTIPPYLYNSLKKKSRHFISIVILIDWYFINPTLITKPTFKRQRITAMFFLLTFRYQIISTPTL